MDAMTPPTLEAFYAAMEPKDRIIHELAAAMLKTRYNPRRSNAYRSYAAEQAKAAAAAAKK
jgi:hypothetical protein